MRNQIEIKAPFGASKIGGSWVGGAGDLALGVKRPSLTVLPTGRFLRWQASCVTHRLRVRGALERTPVFESFLAFGKLLPSDGFVQAQGGVELPFDTAKAGREAFWRVATGKTFTQNGPFGRTWTPMIEVLAA